MVLIHSCGFSHQRKPRSSVSQESTDHRPPCSPCCCLLSVLLNKAAAPSIPEPVGTPCPTLRGSGWQKQDHTLPHSSYWPCTHLLIHQGSREKEPCQGRPIPWEPWHPQTGPHPAPQSRPLRCVCGHARQALNAEPCCGSHHAVSQASNSKRRL